MDIGVFTYIGGSIENMTSAFILGGARNLIDALTQIVVISVTLYLMGQGYLQILGKSEDLAIDVVKTSLVVIVITTLALNADNYTTYVIGTVTALSDGLTHAMFPSSGEDDIYETLDNLLAKGVNQAAYCFEQAGWTPATWTWLFCAFVVMASIGTLTVRAGLIVIGTKFLLSVLLVIGPLFFIAACFPVTRRFIDSWLNKVLENILVQLFGITVVVMATKIIGNFIKVNDITKAIDANPAGIAVQVAIVSGILLYVIQQIPNLAGALSGSFASAMLKISMPKLNPMNAQHSAIAERASWAQQQQNQLSHGGAVKGSNPKHDLSQDLKDRIAAHNMKHRH